MCRLASNIGKVLFFAFSAILLPLPELAQQPKPQDPTLKQRPPVEQAPKSGAVAQAGKIQLDVVATDADGRPASGLEPWDFSILDNGHPRKVKTFRAFGGAVMPEPPVEVILLIDMVDMPFQQVAFVRDQVSRFLRAKGGHLPQPVTIAVLHENGVQIQAHPSTDGNAQAEAVDRIREHISSFNPAMGGDGMVERFQLATRELEGLADNEARKPGRKLLIWAGPGWPMLARPGNTDQVRDRIRFFKAIIQLSTRLREARMVLYSVAPGGASGSGGPNSRYYEEFLPGVSSADQALSGNMALKVLATQTGGLILGPDNNVAGQIDRCVEDANAFYSISFNPPTAEHADEYHELKVQVNRPGVVVRTSAGYYDQPDQH